MDEHFDKQFPPPLPVLPLSYADRPLRRPGMPGRLIAIGVISLMWGLTMMLANGIAAPRLLGALKASVPPAPPARLPPVPPTTVSPHPGDFVRPSGLKSSDRDVVVSAIKSRATLTPDRVMMLDRFLSDVGGTLFTADQPLENERVLKQIRDSGQMPGGRDGGGALGTQFIVTDRGRLEINNSLARLLDPSGNVVCSLDGNVMTDSAGRSKWGARALDDWIEQTRKRCPRLTGYQAAVLLADADKTHAGPWRGFRDDYGFYQIHNDLISADSGNGEIVLERFGATNYLILPDGRVALQSKYPYGFVSGTWEPMQPPPLTFYPALPGDLTAARFLIADAFIGCLMGLVLFVAGLGTLCRDRLAPRLHQAWSLARIPLGVASAVVGIWYFSSVPAYSRGAGIPLVLGVLISLAYPFVVLRILSSPQVVAYYGDRGQVTHILSESWRDALSSRAAASYVGKFFVITTVVSMIAAIFQLVVAMFSAGSDARVALVLGIAGLILATVAGLSRWKWFGAGGKWNVFPQTGGSET